MSFSNAYDLHTHTHTHTRTRAHTHTHTHTHVRTERYYVVIYVCVRTRVCLFVYVCERLRVYMYVKPIQKDALNEKKISHEPNQTFLFSYPPHPTLSASINS